MKKTFSKIIVALLLLYICLIESCKKSNPTEVSNSNQNEIHSWTKMTNGLPTNTPYTIASIGSRLYVYAGNELFSSSDNGGSWIPIGTGLPDSSWISGIAGINNNLAAATEGNGVFTSTNFGVTWIKSVNNGLDAGAHDLPPYHVPVRNLVFASGIGKLKPIKSFWCRWPTT